MTIPYDREPSVAIAGCEGEILRGYDEMARLLAGRLEKRRKAVVVLECYPGVRVREIVEGLSARLGTLRVLDAELAARPAAERETLARRYVTDDRVFGFMAPLAVEEFYDEVKVEELRRMLREEEEGTFLVTGFGASRVVRGDVLIYADLARWEIQRRYRSGECGNWLAGNESEDSLRKYKRGYFLDWRMADRLKRAVLPGADYYLDTNAADDPKLATVGALLEGLRQTAKRPFRLVPYFDPGVWGGTWLERTIGLEAREQPYAWGFDGVPEENSLYLDYGRVRLEVPAVNLVFFEPKSLLGEEVYARFGAEFPIRFDFLDTIGGQNLSLQVHPTAEYIRETFGMFYTQDESYYILDAEPGASVWLGLRDGVDPGRMRADLELAQEGLASFRADRHVHRLPVKKHDHFLIPAGTVHCSGAGSVVLEISATPYIFTFKLWDWERLGLDGKPRPIHLEHGLRNIDWTRTAEWVDRQLTCRAKTVAEGEGWTEERTGLHELQFIETRRHWFTGPVPHDTEGGVQMLNLVEGERAVVESPSDAFAPFEIGYAETFIVPASVGSYTIRPASAGSPDRPLATIQASVRGC
jgi:mannose-6-phosphate isomerase class I